MFAKSLANDSGLFHKVDLVKLLIGLEILAMRTLVSIDMSVNTCFRNGCL